MTLTRAPASSRWRAERREWTTPRAFDDVATRTYRPIRVAPDSPLLDYEITEDYALQDPDWIGMMEFPDDVSDAAMATASRFVVETWMDSPIYWETDPERNIAWFEQNKHVFGEGIHEAVVDDLTSPGYRIWAVGAFNPNPDGSSVAARPGRNRPTTSLRRARTRHRHHSDDGDRRLGQWRRGAHGVCLREVSRDGEPAADDAGHGP